MRRRFLSQASACTASLLGLGIGRPAAAQSLTEIQARLKSTRPDGFPSRPLQLIVPFPAGGGMDINARKLARFLTKVTEANVVVQNRPGAAGFLGASWLVQQTPGDGYTIGILSSNFWGDAILRAEGKWSYKDMEPIAFINYDPLTWLTTTSGPFGKLSLKEVLAQAKARPESVRIAASENSPSGFLVRQVEDAVGAKFTTVMYQGGRAGQTDMLGGHVQIASGYLAEYRGDLDAGKVKVLGVASPTRVSLLKDVPTFNEALGTDQIVWDAFRFVAVPKGVPTDRKAWLEAAFGAALADPELAAEFAQIGASVDRSMTGAARITDEIERRVGRERAVYVKIGRLAP